MHKYGLVIKMLKSAVTQIEITMLTFCFMHGDRNGLINIFPQIYFSFLILRYYGRNQRSIFLIHKYTGTGRYGG